jgi:hypothetical protein
VISKAHLRALRTILDRLRGSSVDWAITGSLGMALQGMDQPVDDIDIQTDRPGAYEIERRLLGRVVKPVSYTESPYIRSHLGTLQIEGVQVEIIGAIQKRLPDGSWESPVEISAHKLRVEAEGMMIPVLSLEYEFEAYRLMGRAEKAALIRNWLDSHRDVRT